MLIPEFVLVVWMFCSLVSVYSLVFWPMWPGVLVTSKPSAPVGCLCSRFSSLQDLWGLDANIASEVPSTCVASGVLGTCLVSGIPSTV